jgi:hypothetical protein
MLQSQIGYFARRFGCPSLSVETISRSIPFSCETGVLLADTPIFSIDIETTLFGQLSRMSLSGLSGTISNLIGYWDGIVSTFGRIAQPTGVG